MKREKAVETDEDEGEDEEKEEEEEPKKQDIQKPHVKPSQSIKKRAFKFNIYKHTQMLEQSKSSSGIRFLLLYIRFFNVNYSLNGRVHMINRSFLSLLLFVSIRLIRSLIG